MNSVETAPPTFWVGESGVRRSGTSLLELLEPAHQPVELGVGEGRVVPDVVAPAGVLDLLGDRAVLLAQLGHGILHGGVVAGCLLVSLTGTSCRVAPTWRTALHPSGRPAAPNHRRPPTNGVTHALARTLMRRDPSGDTRGIVLMLHGGAKTGTDPVTGRSLSLRRTTAMADTLAPHVLSEGLSVWLLRFGVRGWNAGPGEPASPPPSRTPGGHSTRLPRSTRECRSSCSGTRWAPGPPYTSPTTRASSASSALAPWLERVRPGAQARGQAPDRRARPPGPDHLGGDDPGLRRPGAPRSRPRRSTSTSVGRVTTCCRGPATGTGSRCGRRSPCSIAQPCWNDSSPRMVDAGNVFNHLRRPPPPLTRAGSRSSSACCSG